VLILAYLVYAAFRSIKDQDYGSLFTGITLAFHEMGHVLFAPFGEFLMFAGGSITQWLGFSAMNLARYIGDARALELPLVSLGPEAEHDWWYLLSRMGWLRHDTQIAGLVRGVGVLILFLSIAFAAWLLLTMATGSPPQDGEDPETQKFQQWLGTRGS
jgi:hypothetical protein